MELTPGRKRYIDAMPYTALLREVCFAPFGTPLFQGETGKYWFKRLNELRDANSAEQVSRKK
jgi:hypothetical protein